MLKLRYFPRCWKTARILPIIKPGNDPTQPVSNRLISLLPTLSKLGGKLILNRYVKHANKMRIPIPQQSGFTAQLSTSTKFSVLLNTFMRGKSHLVTAAIFLAISKAFDKV
ncbi:hypothetical protein AVEN_74575-1 [Araneus ventricosus]|uniref:Reverse transcriptase domain-containing protein n=1 Tax=Araneus ventricosus TaxID=182803 RepID=A0A4Y2PDF4_ARAVE|nr:hypothetical protein AVEN_74575-1 [Araneus ventricosus]